jgi:coenzyme F420-reducing hydrogenase delta subunit
MFFLSSAEGARWAEIATEMTERILKLGPNPLRNGYEQVIEPDH